MNNLLKDKKWVPFFGVLCAVGWSMAHPFIKLGYQEMQIAGTDTGSKILFAGIRFFAAGLLVMLLAISQKKRIVPEKKNTWIWVILFGLVNTTFHYLFAYIGLGFIPSSRTTIIDSMGGFILILLSCFLLSDDRFTLSKALGCLLGFGGIVLINIHPGENFFADISLQGDGMILLNAFCAAGGGLLARRVSKRMDILSATGISMAGGGLILIAITALVHPSGAWKVTPLGIGILTILTLISAVCFGIYNLLLAYHPISKIAIYNALIPILGVCFSSLIVGEPFLPKYLFAGLIVAAGVYSINRNA